MSGQRWGTVVRFISTRHPCLTDHRFDRTDLPWPGLWSGLAMYEGRRRETSLMNTARRQPGTGPGAPSTTPPAAPAPRLPAAERATTPQQFPADSDHQALPHPRGRRILGDRHRTETGRPPE
ncbi:hypothetical protein [Streptomyces sp. NPDC101776]|uniref:hypothetical protein n=1 Tax=Streptomyces sp. NPDC101776 TaxID=3366146 RepID=UPI003830B3A9